VIFIEINVDKIINAFTKNFNVYHNYALNDDRKTDVLPWCGPSGDAGHAGAPV